MTHRSLPAATAAVSVAALVASLGVSTVLVAQPAPLRPGHLEKPDDPYQAPGPRPGGLATGGPVIFNGFTHVQVNVDGLGANIPGDAANEPSIAVDPLAPNRLTVGWRQFDAINSNFRQAGWAYSHDGGRTWTFPGRIQPGVFRSDPVLAAGADGLFYYYSLRGNFLCDMFISADGGQSWTGPFAAFGGDKQWFSIDTTGGGSQGQIYAAWSIFAGCCGTNTFIRSIDGGMTFASPIMIPQTPIFGTTTIAPNGTVFVGGVDPTDFSNFAVARSSNAPNPGESPVFEFSTSVDLGGTLTLSAGPNPGGLLGQVWLAASHDPNRAGHLYMLASVDPPGPDPLDVHFVRSEDNGSTWSAPVQVSVEATGIGGAPPQWQWFGTLGVAPNGRLDVVYNDTGVTPDPTESALYYTWSVDEGDTWSPPVQVSPAFDQHVGYPQQMKLGDYYQVVSDDVGAHVIWAATFNGEQDVYYVRLGDYDCNGNGIGDEVDLRAGTSADCNDNGIPDSCEIAAGTVEDVDGDGVPDECVARCEADLDGDGIVGPTDLAALLAAWGTNPAGPPDFNADGDVGPSDLATLLAAWGPCS
ncbi:MAG: hypothetical protein KDA25_11395 [Phycisphaerales bacterium]|nr:hypothetical protein [Phycisphaerales bacterium]